MRHFFSLRKAKQTLRHIAHAYRRKKHKLTSEQSFKIRSLLESLQKAVLEKDSKHASELSAQASSLAKLYLRKNSFEHGRDLIFALAFALAVAILIRQMWFEFYEIPSGSMRPTLKEEDRLIVSKTDFGINLPLSVKHLYFDPELVKRSGIFIFTGENMDIQDVDTKYFYLFPGKKQFVKRLIGKPGDTLYFYGGQIYGIDAQGNPISHELQLPELSRIDHVPFIRFEGNVSLPVMPIQGIYSPVIFYQMNEPVARLWLTAQNQINGTMLNLSQTRNNQASSLLKDYSDLWGFKNYATARLLTKDQAKQQSDLMISEMEDGLLYLELRHHPSLTSAKLMRDEYGRLRPVLGFSTSIIPLNQEHLHLIFNNLYTSRFFVKNGFMRRYGSNPANSAMQQFLPHLSDVPDGCYEFYYGKAYEIKWGGIARELPPSHPLYKFDPARVQLFFNLGIELDTRFNPQTRNQRLVPSRYAYFRDQELYLLGSPVIKKEDPTMVNYLEREAKRETAGKGTTPYTPFVDDGPPLLSNGELNTAFIKEFGLSIPPKMYLALGDNYANSSDSRDFGFVPQENIRGGPDWIFWPPGKRWGTPNQPHYTLITLPRLIIWLIAALCLGIWWIVHRRHNRLPLHFD